LQPCGNSKILIKLSL